MFEELHLLGPTEESIIVQTRKGRSLTNFIAPEPTFQHLQMYKLLLDKYGGNWVPRKPACGGYNCTGHVWASRRTVLPDEHEWRGVLDDDGYRKLADGETPYPGDVVMYVVEPSEEIWHVARIVETREGLTSDTPRIPWAISKWDLKSGEVMHSVYDVPHYADKAFAYKIEFWTDRPSRQGVNK